MTSTLTISHLTKAFGGVNALSDVSLNVAPGERVALLGHNGAGKSTLMKIILGLIAADSGAVRILGWAARVDAHRRQQRAEYRHNDARTCALFSVVRVARVPLAAQVVLVADLL